MANLDAVRGHQTFLAPGGNGAVFSDLRHTAELIAQDPSTAIARVRIFRSALFVLGIETMWRCAGREYITDHSSRNGYYAAQPELPPLVLHFLPTEEICSLGYSCGEICDALWLRTSAGREVRAGTQDGREMTFIPVPRGHKLVAFHGSLHGVLCRPGFASAPTFWRKYGWLVMLQHSTSRDPGDPRGRPVLDAKPPGLDEGEESLQGLLWRVVTLQPDCFRLIMMQLRYAWLEAEAL